MKQIFLTLLTKLRALGRRLFRRTPRGGVKPLATEFLEELPDVLCKGTVYVLGEGANHWSVALICPCGCGETLHMNLLADTRPRWTVERHGDGTVTLSPSVWRQIGCRSHFFLRRGLIVWCAAAVAQGT